MVQAQSLKLRKNTCIPKNEHALTQTHAHAQAQIIHSTLHKPFITKLNRDGGANTMMQSGDSHTYKDTQKQIPTNTQIHSKRYLTQCFASMSISILPDT